MKIAASLHPDIEVYVRPPVAIDVMGRQRRLVPLVDRMRDRIAPPNDRGCTEWLGHRNHSGYGQVGVRGRQTNLVHRVCLELATGQPIPSGLFALHHCDNPPCCNPEHLYVGTAMENSRDARLRGRLRPLMNERNARSKLSDEQVAEVRRRWAAGETCKALGSEFGLHGAHVSRLVRGLVRPLEDGSTLPKRSPLLAASVPQSDSTREARRPDPRRRSPEQRAEVAAREEEMWSHAAALYRQGMSTTQVGSAIGRDSSQVSRHLRRRGVEMRPRVKYHAEIDLSEVQRLRSVCATAAEMRAVLGIGQGRLNEALDMLALHRFRCGRPSRARRRPAAAVPSEPIGQVAA